MLGFRISIALSLLASGCTEAGGPALPDAGSRDAPSGAVDGAVPGDAGADGGGALEPDAPGALDAPIPSGGDVGGTDAGASVADPSAAGPYAVARSTVMVTGATYQTFVPALPAGERAPLVLMKHGFQLATANYAMLCERIASHGFVVVGVDTASGLFGGPTNVDERDATIAAVGWATTTAPVAASVDAERVAVVGHSRGGKVAVMVAAAEPRIDAALLLDPVNGCGPGTPYSASCPDVTTAPYAGAISVPVGVMGETNNAAGGFMPCAPAAENYATIYAALTSASWAVSWTFTGADHMDFTDDGGGFAGSFCTDGPGDDVVIRADVRTLAVAFLRRHLRDEPAMDEWLSGTSVPSGIIVDGP